MNIELKLTKEQLEAIRNGSDSVSFDAKQFGDTISAFLENRRKNTPKADPYCEDMTLSDEDIEKIAREQVGADLYYLSQEFRHCWKTIREYIAVRELARRVANMIALDALDTIYDLYGDDLYEAVSRTVSLLYYDPEGQSLSLNEAFAQVMAEM